MVSVVVRRLLPGDGAVLALLARDAADFDLATEREPYAPLDLDRADAYLGNDLLRHWVAEADDEVVGELLCHVIPLPHGQGGEVLLYSIGVRSGWRRRGVGSMLVAAMNTWVTELGLTLVWVLADNAEAVQFYRACGFVPDPDGDAALMMSRDGI